jgi:hypothetical protein
MKRPLYYPDGLWCKHDFSINKYYWIKHGVQTAYDIRVENLVCVRKVLCKRGVKNWLQGKTMQGLYTESMLPDDHDDDVGVFCDSRDIVLSDVKKDLEESGFSLIRNSESIISFERNFRYIDVCLFSDVAGGKIGYSRKEFDKKHFNDFDKILWSGIEFEIPRLTDELLESMYPSNEDGKKSKKKHKRKSVGKSSASPSYNGRLFRYCAILKRLLIEPLRVTKKVFKKRKKIRVMFGKKLLALGEVAPPPLSLFLVWVYPLFGVSLKTFNKAEFLDLLIEPEDSFNWGWRIRHLGPVTGDGRFKRIGDIVEYLSDPGVVEKIEGGIEETDTSFPFFPPTNYDMRFWWGGNNYFWYCVKYQFRKNVEPYSNANNYIINKQNPYLYTKEYYESLPVMSDKEIKSFLRSSPIEITNGAVTSGKHRVFAMIGRLASAKPYIPIRATLRAK